MTDMLDRRTPSKNETKGRSGWVPLLIGLGVIGLGVLLLRSTGGEAKNQTGGAVKRPIPVMTTVASRQSVPVLVSSIGTAEATSTVAVRSQVEGQLLAVHFRQGDFVRAGALLFTLDDRAVKTQVAQAQATVNRDLAQVAQAQATLTRDRAQLRTAQTQLGRYQSLLSQGAISREQFDEVRTNAESLAATVRASEAAVATSQSVVRADQANVRNTQVQQSYTRIRSPIDGRTGSLNFYAGNLVRANDTTALVTINRLSPIYVTFTVPEQQLPAIRKAMARGKPKVTASAPGDSGRMATGVLGFIDNAVDATTGTIKLRGIFPNRDNALLPGQFVNASLTLNTLVEAVVVPSQAVQAGQQGEYVFVVKPDRSVESRPVAPQFTYQGKTVIAHGLKGGETVVTDGQLQLVPGTKVQVKQPAQPGRQR